MWKTLPFFFFCVCALACRVLLERLCALFWALVYCTVGLLYVSDYSVGGGGRKVNTAMVPEVGFDQKACRDSWYT